MRTYERTHPWIDFTFDLRRMPYTTWLLLGEAQSKARHVAGVPLLPSVAERFYALYLAKGVAATTAIEGNTLSEDDVLRRQRGELRVPPSKEYLVQEVDNILEACQQIGDRILAGEPAQISIEDLLGFNRLVLRNLPLPEEVEPGRFRQHDVGVGTYQAAPHGDAAFLTARLCDWLNREFTAPPGQEIAFGLLQAIAAHLYIAWIHPFGDGNGRTARLVEFQILLACGVPAVAAHLLSNHYNQTRAEYYRRLDLAHHAGGNPVVFLEYAVQGFVDGLQEQIETIRQQQVLVHWINLLHEAFRGLETATGIRRRHLAIDLSLAGGTVAVAAVRRLTARLAEAYATKTDRTIRRDLAALEEMDLIEQTGSGVRARVERILAFLPPVRGSSPSST